MTAPVDELLVIDQPGVYDIPADAYHRDPVPGGSLSSSGARRLLPPSCPALYRHWADNPPEHSHEFDMGHAAHLLVLGEGPDLHVVDAPDWRTKAAKAERADAYAAGLVPLLPHEFDQVQDMAAALRRDPLAMEALAGDGTAEQTLIWQDPDTGVWCRARPDWMTTDGLVDYKTTTAVDPDAVARSVATYGYHVQAPFYLDGAVHLDLVDPDATFAFVFQSKSPPYLVSVVELDDEAMATGRALAAQARRTYADCVLTGRWPGYSDDVALISLPRYARRPQEDL